MKEITQLSRVMPIEPSSVRPRRGLLCKDERFQQRFRDVDPWGTEFVLDSLKQSRRINKSSLLYVADCGMKHRHGVLGLDTFKGLGIITRQSLPFVGNVVVEQFDATSEDLLENLAVDRIMLEVSEDGEAGW